MKILLDRIMRRRAAALTERLRKHIVKGSRLADIGSGTGHNADCWRTTLGVQVDEFDVADLHWIGPGPHRFDGSRIPAADAAYEIVTLLFVLHYVPDPVCLLREAQRTCSRSVLVIQSSYRGIRGRIFLALRGWVWGRGAFRIARLLRVIPEQPCPLLPRRSFTHEELCRLFEKAGYLIHSSEPLEWWGMNVSRDLFVLEKRP